ncbi:MAG: DUF177 domain-containing protein [Candidatus Firestonebacteria bacterium]|nr:DUF177 domain-containing protein [Candidatus Firestonebacteria bacterium]
MLPINVLGLNENPISLDGDFSPRELDLQDADLEVVGPVHLKLAIQRLGDKVHIRGSVTSEIRLACSRCLADFNFSLVTTLDLVALPVGGEARPSQRVEENAEEEDASVMAYEHDQVNLVPEVRTAIILGVPMKPLCAEDCPGLCLECGERLDASHRPHTDAAPEGPFSRLKKFLDQ